jgi:hypothetical protein
MSINCPATGIWCYETTLFDWCIQSKHAPRPLSVQKQDSEQTLRRQRQQGQQIGQQGLQIGQQQQQQIGIYP